MYVVNHHLILFTCNFICGLGLGVEILASLNIADSRCTRLSLKEACYCVILLTQLHSVRQAWLLCYLLSIQANSSPSAVNLMLQYKTYQDWL